MLQFYDVRLPFDPNEQPGMHGAVLLPLFATALIVGTRTRLAPVACRQCSRWWPEPAACDALTRRERVPRRDRDPRRCALDPRGAARAGAACRAARRGRGRSSRRRGGGDRHERRGRERRALAWERWDLYDAPTHPVGVDYVWDANYNGIRFPDQRTVVLRVRAAQRPLYWRATVLEGFDGSRWREDVDDLGTTEGGQPPADPLVPRQPPARWVRQEVEVVGLRDDHLVAATSLVMLRTASLRGGVSLLRGGLARRNGGLEPGERYIAWSAVPRPSPKQLAAAKPDYPSGLDRDLQVEAGVQIRPFGDPTRAGRVREILADPLTANLSASSRSSVAPSR